MRVERLVFEALDKYFWWHKGVDAEKRVTVTIDPYDYLYAYSKQDSDIIWFAGRILVEKYQPDRPPRMMPTRIGLSHDTTSNIMLHAPSALSYG